MAQRSDDIIQRLVVTVQELPAERAAEVLDFASYLHSRYAERAPDRGSPEALLRALNESGPLEFAPGELDRLLADITRSRDSELDDRG